MIVVMFLLLLTSTLYATLMVALLLGWRKMPAFSLTANDSETPDPSVSIVIAARNEEKNLPGCLTDILRQQNPPVNFEILVVDDHSTDHTSAEVEKFRSSSKNIKLISLAGSGTEGKKTAISAGIAQARGELIITTDADCRFSLQWLRSITDYYKRFKPVMICGPVVFEPQKSFRGWFTELEFMSLIASGAGALGLKKPLMCNGANMAFQREVFSGSNIFKDNLKWASGDDVFLMRSISEQYSAAGIHFLRSEPAIVRTNPPNSIREFLQQRIRWGSKTKVYLNSFTGWVAMLVFLNSLLLTCSTMMIAWHPGLSVPVLFAWGLKLLSEGLLLLSATSFFRRRQLLWGFVPFQLVHILYILIVSAMAAFSRYTWKQRRH